MKQPYITEYSFNYYKAATHTHPVNNMFYRYIDGKYYLANGLKSGLIRGFVTIEPNFINKMEKQKMSKLQKMMTESLKKYEGWLSDLIDKRVKDIKRHAEEYEKRTDELSYLVLAQTFMKDRCNVNGLQFFSSMAENKKGHIDRTYNEDGSHKFLGDSDNRINNLTLKIEVMREAISNKDYETFNTIQKDLDYDGY
jgi:hypothetical protein